MSLCGGFFFAFADFSVEFILVHFRGNIRGVLSAETSGAITAFTAVCVYRKLLCVFHAQIAERICAYYVADLFYRMMTSDKVFSRIYVGTVVAGIEERGSGYSHVNLGGSRFTQ